MEQVLKKEKQIQAKPIMKWAGGKTQMLGDIMPKIPQKYGKYIEPFIGGGALFFALSPDKAIIADSNPELINMYRQVADNVEAVISYLKKYKNTKEDFYEVRSLDWFKLKKEEAAARTIYLNKTCFNGLYRVNKKGQFNVPFGKYKAPNFCDEEALFAASDVLKKATITCGDYLSVLKEYAEPVDLDELLGDLTLKKLNEIFKEVMKRQVDKIDPVRSKFGKIEKEEVTVSDKFIYIHEYMHTHHKFSFRQLLEKQKSKMHIVVTFLAVLEMMKLGEIRVEQEETCGEIMIERVEEAYGN